MTCSFEGCGKPQDSHGYCAGHAAQYRRGQTLRPLRSKLPKGQGPERPVTRDLSAVRAWANRNGFIVGERGRIPKDVFDAYQNSDNFD